MVNHSLCSSIAPRRAKDPSKQFFFHVKRLLKFYFRSELTMSLSRFLEVNLMTPIAPRCLRFLLWDHFFYSKRFVECGVQRIREEEELKKVLQRKTMEEAKRLEEVAREQQEREHREEILEIERNGKIVRMKVFSSQMVSPVANSGCDEVGFFTITAEGKLYSKVIFQNRFKDFSYEYYIQETGKRVRRFLTKSQISVVLNRGGLELNPGPLTGLVLAKNDKFNKYWIRKHRRFVSTVNQYSLLKYLSFYGFVEDDLSSFPFLFEDRVFSYDILVFAHAGIYQQIVSFQFNPFISSNAPLILNYDDDGRFIKGRYGDENFARYFVFDRQSKLSRVHPDIWEQYFVAPGYEGYDLVANFPLQEIDIRGSLYVITRKFINLVEDLSFYFSCFVDVKWDIFEDVTSCFEFQGILTPYDSYHRFCFKDSPQSYFVQNHPFRVYYRGGSPRGRTLVYVSMIVDYLPHSNCQSVFSHFPSVNFTGMMMELKDNPESVDYGRPRYEHDFILSPPRVKNK
jgi:hypothetical protein